MNQKQIMFGSIMALVIIAVGIAGLVLPMIFYSFPLIVDNMTKLEYVMYLGAIVSFPLIIFGLFAFIRISMSKKGEEEEAATKRSSSRMLYKLLALVCAAFALAGFLLWLFYPNAPASPFDAIEVINNIFDIIVFAIIEEWLIWMIFLVLLSPMLFLSSKCEPNEMYDPESMACIPKEKKK